MTRTNARRNRAGVVQIDLNAAEVDKLDTLLEAHGLRSRSAYFRHLLRVQPTPPRPRRIQTSEEHGENILVQHVADLRSPFPTAAEVHAMLEIPPAPSCINEGRPPLSPVRLVDGRWVNADETTPEHRHTAADEHPGEGYRNFPCLPLPDETTPNAEE